MNMSSGCLQPNLLTVSVAAALDDLPIGRFHWILVLATGLLRLAISYCDQLAPFLFAGLRAEWGMSLEAQGHFTACDPAGNIVGVGITLLSDSLGRKPGIIFGSAIVAIASLLMFLSPSFPLLLVFRGMQTAGIAISLNSNITWFNEQTPRIGRGLLYSLGLVGWPIGKQFLIAVAALTPPGKWRELALIGGVLHALAVLAFAFLPESARFYAAMGDHEKAVKALRRVHALNRFKGRLPHIEAPSTDEERDAVLSSAALYDAADSIPAQDMLLPVPMKPSLSKRLKQLTREPHAGNMFYAIGLFVGLSVTTLVLDTYGPQKFQQLLAPQSSELPYGDLLWFNGGDLLGVLASGFIVDRIGRRGCFSLGFFGQAGFLALLIGWQQALLASGVQPQNPLAQAVLIPLGTAAASLRVFHWDGASLWTSEAFPTELRATALAVANIAMRLASMLLVALTSRSLGSIPATTFFSLLIGFLVLAGVFATVALPVETAHRSLASP
jgi:MFS family permease